MGQIQILQWMIQKPGPVNADGDTDMAVNLPTPPYTTVNNHDIPITSHTNVQEEHEEQCILGPMGDTEGEMDIYSRLAGFDFVNISRENLKEYCIQYIPRVNRDKKTTEQLRNCVFNNM